ncbi:cofactor-independent phosphoglycerate mutase [Dacryopinax primogenitus]|uniref:2,3-bisphosphoglycerate-independent phosphoglycerate mutase n=1 Tax=Dacryopinax primogenitus (strain DJM 731) TaxID=1858805 RepID=M5FY63_DACPD|nr:cofactor-independent phosphoglycerate mutase [Dacryopinax primogenitus]EJU03001.1 cofactor-independent phosphoglycerate mutase [Dacryopinax primogenitus]
MVQVKNKVCLIVHDGWGVARHPGLKGNAIEAGDSTTMDELAKKYNYRLLEAHGLAVGLNDGLMGNSEVGHLNIGAGRIVWQDIVRIDQAIRKHDFHRDDNIVKSFQHAKNTNGRLHLLGLVSDGGVHSHIEHLFALLETAKEQQVPEVYVHFIGDGRDTDPHSGLKHLQHLLDFTKKEGVGKVVTVVGRYYAMDRDKRWERVKIAVDALVRGEGEKTDDLLKTYQERYDKDETDEFLKPMICGGSETRIQDNDTLFFFNYRSDRMRELVTMFGLPEKPIEIDIPKNLNITTMSRYNPEWTFPVAFPPQGMSDVLAEWLSKKGVKQCHIAETEKYAHVTFFFNGGVEKQFPGEDRFMIPSPKVPTYDQQPEMSVQEVADKVTEEVKSKKYEFVMCNFAPPDMVGHTGKYEAAVKAITATDKAVKTIYEACEEAGYILVVTADHGNAEQMINPETGEPHTAHTTNPVPLIITGSTGALRVEQEKAGEEGALCDVAPTVLDLLGLDIPPEMTGHSLLKH